MPIWVAILVVVLLLLVVLGISYRPISEVMSIWRTPICGLNALPMEGQVKVTGRASQVNVDSIPIKSPITQTDCLLWEIEVKELKQRGRGSSWVTVYRDYSKDPIEVRNELGRVHVQPNGASLFLQDDFKAPSGLFKKMDPEIISTISNLGVATKGFFGFDKRLKVFERCIKPDDPVFIFGEIQYLGGSKSIGSSAGKMPFIISDRDEHALVWNLVGSVAVRIFLTVLIGGLLVFSLLMALFYSGN